MPKALKIAFWTGSGVVGVLVFLAVAGLFFIDANDFKPQLEVAASQATGMKVQVEGAVSIGFFPRLHITLEDVQVRNRGIEVGSARQVKFGIGLFSLLGKKVRVRTVSLKNARLYIERDQHGVFNFENAEVPKGTPRTLDLVRLSVLDAAVSYVDKQSGNGFAAKDCTLEASRLKLTGVAGVDLMTNIHITANMACARVSSKEFVVSDLNLSAQGENGIFHLKPVSMQVFSGQGSGQVSADFSDQVPRWQVQYRLSKFRVEEFLEPQKPMQNLKGSMDFFTRLSMQGKTLKAMQQTAGGEATLRGENLTLVGRDLDRELSRYDSTQNFNLVDAGALFFAGPIGVAITKGYDFANLLRGKGGSTEIRTLVSEWRIEHGVAEAQDVAIATNENRLALHGGLDFANQRYQHVTVALVDAKGCTLVRQKILGSFRKPVVEKPNIIQAITGPAIKLLTRTKEMFSDRRCELFYSGTVAPPKEGGQGKQGKAVE